ncbi:hypothetical protein [Streptomyces sp. NPDC057545]|uniref:hypothetical protein n=1 Tax=Streptomyces sp. NPDC057545 TaxID=3346164 RepID=UPI00369F5D59
MLRSTTTALGVSAVLTLLALVGCSLSTGPADAVRTTAAEQVPSTPSEFAPVPSNELAKRLLTEDDLGAGYTRKPDRVEQHDDVAVIGCAALERLGSNADTGSGLEFPRKAKASFTYNGSSTSEVSEELYYGVAPGAIPCSR